MAESYVDVGLHPRSPPDVGLDPPSPPEHLHPLPLLQLYLVSFTTILVLVLARVFSFGLTIVQRKRYHSHPGSEHELRHEEERYTHTPIPPPSQWLIDAAKATVPPLFPLPTCSETTPKRYGYTQHQRPTHRSRGGWSQTMLATSQSETKISSVEGLFASPEFKKHLEL
jgi:hypothetical protein